NSPLNNTPITPTLDAAQALAAAASALNLAVPTSTVISTGAGIDQVTNFTGANISFDDIPVSLAYVPVADGGVTLSWQMVIHTLDTQHWYNVAVNAANGTLNYQVDWSDDDTYTVYKSPAVE